MKVRIEKPTRYFYPDVSVVCGPPRYDDNERDVLLNPLIVFEVLSDGTERYDRGPKFLAYQQCESLQEYVLISQNAYVVEHYRRDGSQWIYTPIQGRDARVPLPAVGCELPLDEIYYQVEISSP